jgi:hypothetical protein
MSVIASPWGRPLGGIKPRSRAGAGEETSRVHPTQCGRNYTGGGRTGGAGQARGPALPWPCYSIDSPGGRCHAPPLSRAAAAAARRPASRGGKRSQPPFCLVVSLVNPHDVSVFPRFLANAGYALSAFADFPIDLPPNFADDLSGKPDIQAFFRDHSRFLGALTTDEQRLQYVRFYAYLHTLTDA